MGLELKVKMSKTQTHHQFEVSVTILANGNYCGNDCPGHLVEGYCNWFNVWMEKQEDLETGKIEFLRCKDCVDLE